MVLGAQELVVVVDPLMGPERGATRDSGGLDDTVVRFLHAQDIYFVREEIKRG